MEIKYRFAWFPIVVDTWRPKGTKALIWLQRYYETDTKYCRHLGKLSYEFYK